MSQAYDFGCIRLAVMISLDKFWIELHFVESRPFILKNLVRCHE